MPLCLHYAGNATLNITCSNKQAPQLNVIVTPIPIGM
jgi:hypothetical protein